MLGLLSYAEQQVDVEMDKVYKQFGCFLSEAEVVVAGHVADAHNSIDNTTVLSSGICELY